LPPQTLEVTPVIDDSYFALPPQTLEVTPVIVGSEFAGTSDIDGTDSTGFDIPVGANVTDAELQMGEFFARISESPVPVPIDADTSAAEKAYNRTKALIEQVLTIPVNIEVSGGGSVVDEIRASGVIP
jgi:hypothetical protein